MYRVLVVDDEEIITNSLVHLLQKSMEDTIDVYPAYSGLQAMDYLQRASFDIIITDIQMPGMDGIELLKQARQLYPTCRVIFLSGHDDFTYAYQAMQYHATRYVLKNEDDHVLLEAIGECMEEIDRESRRDAILTRANEQVRQCLPILKRDFLGQLLNGDLLGLESLSDAFVHYEVALKPMQPVILLAARLDDGKNVENPTAVDVVVKDCLKLRCECCVARTYFMLWLIQSDDNTDPVQTVIKVRGAAERLQRTLVQTLNVSVSFVLDTMPVRWEELQRKAEELYQAMICMLDKQEKMAFVYLSYFEKNSISPEQRLHTILRDVLEEIRNALEAGSIETFESVMASMIQCVVRQEKDQSIELLSFFNRLNAVLIAFVDSHDLYEFMEDEGFFRAFLATPMAGTAMQHAERFARIAHMALDGWGKRQRTKTDALLETVDEYISKHLGEELSLVTLSERVYLNPSYLSRRYKELSGQNLSDAIMRARLNRAMELLCEDGAKVREIAEQVGYLSPTHFIRVFKKVMGVTPQEWRDRQLDRNK